MKFKYIKIRPPIQFPFKYRSKSEKLLEVFLFLKPGILELDAYLLFLNDIYSLGLIQLLFLISG